MNVVTTPTLVIVGCTPSRVAILTDFFRGLPKDLPCCVLLVDLSSEPDPSRLGNMAREHSAAAPCLLYDGAPLKKGEIYVAPLNRIARLEADTFRLASHSDIELAPGHRLGIDPSSLGDDTVLAVLTQMRPELQRVFCHFKSEGALTLLHLEEIYFSLSLHDLEPGCPDRAIPARNMGSEIQKWTALRGSDRASEADWQSALQSCVDEVKQSTGEDFSDYRDPTLIRRIRRRLAIRNLTLESYVELLKKDRDEIQFLAEDWLIKVTRFFRDREVFEALKSKVLPGLVRAGKGPLRVWIPGCATGEEAYSIAILILEHMRTEDISRNLQIFATDGRALWVGVVLAKPHLEALHATCRACSSHERDL